MYSLILIPNLIGSFVKNESLNMSMMFLYFLIVVFSLSLSMFLAVLSGKIRTYVLVGNMFCICTYLVGGGIIPATYLPENMLSISKFMPAYNFIQMLIKVSSNVPLNVYANTIILYAVLTVMFAVAGGLILKRKEA